MVHMATELIKLLGAEWLRSGNEFTPATAIPGLQSDSHVTLSGQQVNANIAVQLPQGKAIVQFAGVATQSGDRWRISGAVPGTTMKVAVNTSDSVSQLSVRSGPLHIESNVQ